MGRKELIELAIQERISKYFEKRTGDGNEEVRRNDEFLKRLKEKIADNLIKHKTGIYRKYLKK